MNNSGKTVNIDSPVTGTGNWRGANLVNPGGHPVDLSAAASHFIAVDGVRLSGPGDVPSWLTLHPTHNYGDPPVRPPRFDVVVLDVHRNVKRQTRAWWSATVTWVKNNPTATFPEYKAWFVANQGSTVFYSDTFLPFMQQAISDSLGISLTWVAFRDWIVAHADYEDILEMF